MMRFTSSMDSRVKAALCRRLCFLFFVLSAIVFAAILSLSFVYDRHTMSNISQTQRLTTQRQQQLPPFSLVVKLSFKTEATKEQFLQNIAPLVSYVRDHEPDTLTYEVLLSDKDPLHVLILERYLDKDNAFLNVHRTSSAFLEFRPKLQAMQERGEVTVDGHSYIDAVF